MSVSTWLAAGVLLIGIVLFVVYTRMGKLIRCVLFTAVTGPCSLLLLWLLGKAFATGLSLTPFSLLVSAVLGIPGVLGMLLLQLL